MKTATLLFFCLLQLLGAPALLAREIESNGYRISIEPAADWVEPFVVDPKAPVSKSAPLRVLAADVQINLLPQQPQRYEHRAMLANDSTARDKISELQIDFQPAFQTLTLHEVAVLRGGERLPRLADARIDLIRREAQLERSLYDGAVTAVIVLRDVRVGDRLEWSYTLGGANPVFGGKYAAGIALIEDKPLDLLRLRMLHASARTITARAHYAAAALQQSERDGVVTTTLTRTQLPGFTIEPGTPAHWVHWPWLQITEWRSWSEVAAWARELYALPGTLTPELTALVQQWKHNSDSQESYARKALAFVQEDIRYFAIEIGQSSHRPAPPAETLQRKYGDCKDKSTLLVALLNAGGVQAAPALVSLRYGAAVADWLPAPHSFDHVITRASVDGKTFWLDATRSHQYGRLERLGIGAFGKALTITDDTQALSEIEPRPATEEIAYELEERLDIERAKPVKLTITATMRGERAEATRAFIASKSAEELTESTLQYDSRRYPGLKVLQSVETRDDREQNVVQLIARYSAEDLFSYGEGKLELRLNADLPAQVLYAPTGVQRKSPLAIGAPARYRQSFVVMLPYEVPMKAGKEPIVRDPHFQWELRESMQNRMIRVDYETRVLKPEVGASAYDAYFRQVKEVSRRLGYILHLLPADPALYGKLSIGEDPILAGFAGKTHPSVLRMYARIRFERAVADLAIEARDLSSKNIARAYVERGRARSLLLERTQGLQDVQAALQADPNNADAMLLGGDIYLYEGQYQRALEEFDKAQSLGADEVHLTYSRGQAYYYLGQFDKAKAEFRRAYESGSSARRFYHALWLSWSMRHLGEPLDPLISEFQEEKLGDGWPAAGLGVFFGKLTPEQVVAAAQRDEKEQALQLCEAYFYLGQFYLLQNDTQRAKESFERSVATGASMYLEHTFAKAELARLR